MKRVKSLILGALILVMATLMTACGGGGGGEVIVTPEVTISPTPTITVVERLQQLGMTGLEAMYDEFPDGGYLRVEWQDPNPVLGDGDRTDYGANKVFVRYWDLGQQAFVEVDITSFPEVQFLATAGNPTAGGDRLLWFLNWHEIPVGASIDVTGTVRVWAEDFFAIWDRLNGGPVTSIEDSFGVTVEVIDGVVQIDDSDGIPLWIAALAVGISRVAPMMGWCPQIDKPWQVSREAGEEPGTNELPVAVLVASPESGNAPLAGVFDASGSYDPDGDIVGYEWDRDGNGSFEFPGPAQVSYNYSEPGTYTVRVRVMDDHGGKTTVSATVTVTEPQTENQPPVAILQLVGDVTTGPAPFTVTVDASESYDLDGYIVGYDYFFYGGGGHYDGGHNITSWTNTYDTPGPYSIHLRVHDDEGATDWSDTIIEILVTEPSTGPIWGDSDYDWTKVQLDVTPMEATLVIADQDKQQIFADLYYNGDLVWQGSRGRYYTIEYTTNAPGGSLTADGLFNSVVAGSGTWNITVKVTLQAVPPANNVFTKTAVMTVN